MRLSRIRWNMHFSDYYYMSPEQQAALHFLQDKYHVVTESRDGLTKVLWRYNS